MAKPWEKYQATPEAGPWAKYGAPAAQPAPQPVPQPIPQPAMREQEMWPTDQDARMVGRRDTMYNRLRTGTPLSAPPQPEGPQLFEAEGASPADQGKIAAGFLLNMNPAARADIVREVLGDQVEFSEDAEGKPIVKFGGEWSYLDRPGFDIRDANQLAFEIAKFLPIGKLTNFLRAKGAGGLVRGMAAAPAAGAIQAGSEAASGLFGSEQGIDPLNVGLASVGGAVGEWLAAPLNRFTPEARRAIGSADGMGVNLRAAPGTQVRQVAQAADAMTPVERGAAMPDIAAGVSAAKATARANADDLFTMARTTNANVPMSEVQAFSGNLRANLVQSGFDLADPSMRPIVARLDELGQLASTEGASAAKLNALELWRRRVMQMSPRDGTPTAMAARELRREYDTFMDNMFNRDMIGGDEQALGAWRQARGAWAGYKRTFDENRVIKSLADMDTTPEMMRSWIFNANGVNANKEAALVVRGLNRILGPQSEQMNALRGEIMLDIAEPLLRDVPNIRAFVRNYDTAFKKNPSLQRALFPNGMGDFGDLVSIARGVSKRPGAALPVGGESMFQMVNRKAAAVLVGHGLARGQVRIGFVRGLGEKIQQGTMGRMARQNILRDGFGLDPTVPMFRSGAAVGAAGATFNANQPEE